MLPRSGVGEVISPSRSFLLCLPLAILPGLCLLLCLLTALYNSSSCYHFDLSDLKSPQLSPTNSIPLHLPPSVTSHIYTVHTHIVTYKMSGTAKQEEYLNNMKAEMQSQMMQELMSKLTERYCILYYLTESN